MKNINEINEHDVVVAKTIKNIPKGSVGTVIHAYHCTMMNHDNHDWCVYEVEFIVNNSSVVETVLFNQIEKK